MLPGFSPSFERFIAPARAKPQLWRLIVGVVAAMAIYFAFTRAVVIASFDWGLDLFAALEGGGSPLDTLVLLFSFLGMSLGVIVAALVFQHRGLMSLLGPDQFAFRRHFIIAFVVTFALAVVALAVSFLFEVPQPHLPVSVWLVWLLPALALVLIQTSAEELVFRGYLQQQLAVRFSSRWVWWVLPSVLFGMLHYEPEVYGANAWLVVADTALFGLVAADVTARTGNLGAAIAIHFVNNAMAFLFVAPIDDLNGLALNVSLVTTSDIAAVRISLMSDFALILIAYLIYLRIMARRGL